MNAHTYVRVAFIEWQTLQQGVQPPIGLKLTYPVVNLANSASLSRILFSNDPILNYQTTRVVLSSYMGPSSDRASVCHRTSQDSHLYIVALSPAGTDRTASAACSTIRSCRQRCCPIPCCGNSRRPPFSWEMLIRCSTTRFTFSIDCNRLECGVHSRSSAACRMATSTCRRSSIARVQRSSTTHAT